MIETRNGIVAAGARALLRRHPIIWSLYAVNLLLGLVAALPALVAMSGVLDSSMAADGLYRGFDLSVFMDLMMNRDAALTGHMAGSALLALLFLPVIFFATPGVLEAYRRDPGDRMPIGEFFQTSAAFFWRFVRLFLIAGVAFTLLRLLSGRARSLASAYADRSLRDSFAFWLEIAVIIAGFLLLLLLRMWFDVAQAHTVVTGERRIRRSAAAGFRLAFAHFGSLLWIYLATFVTAAVALYLLVALWRKLPASAVGTTFLLTQLVVLLSLTTRFWQRASSVLWVERLRPVIVVPAEEEVPPPVMSAGVSEEQQVIAFPELVAEEAATPEPTAEQSATPEPAAEPTVDTPEAAEPQPAAPVVEEPTRTATEDNPPKE